MRLCLYIVLFCSYVLELVLCALATLSGQKRCHSEKPQNHNGFGGVLIIKCKLKDDIRTINYYVTSESMSFYLKIAF